MTVKQPNIFTVHPITCMLGRVHLHLRFLLCMLCMGMVKSRAYLSCVATVICIISFYPQLAFVQEPNLATLSININDCNLEPQTANNLPPSPGNTQKLRVASQEQVVHCAVRLSSGEHSQLVLNSKLKNNLVTNTPNVTSVTNVTNLTTGQSISNPLAKTSPRLLETDDKKQLPEHTSLAYFDKQLGVYSYTVNSGVGRYVVWVSPQEPTYVLFSDQTEIHYQKLHANEENWSAVQTSRGDKQPSILISTKKSGEEGILIVETNLATYYLHIIAKPNQSMNLVLFQPVNAPNPSNIPLKSSPSLAASTTTTNTKPNLLTNNIASTSTSIVEQILANQSEHTPYENTRGVKLLKNTKPKHNSSAQNNSSFILQSSCEALPNCSPQMHANLKQLMPMAVYSEDQKNIIIKWRHPLALKPVAFTYDAKAPGEHVFVPSIDYDQNTTVIEGMYDNLKLVLSDDIYISIIRTP